MPFANPREEYNIINNVYRIYPKGSSIQQGIEVDCIEVKDGKAYFKDIDIIPMFPNTPHNIRCIDIKTSDDKLLNGFGNWCLQNNIKLNDSNKITKQIMCFLNSDYYKQLIK